MSLKVRFLWSLLFCYCRPWKQQLGKHILWLLWWSHFTQPPRYTTAYLKWGWREIVSSWNEEHANGAITKRVQHGGDWSRTKEIFHYLSLKWTNYINYIDTHWVAVKKNTSEALTGKGCTLTKIHLPSESNLKLLFHEEKTPSVPFFTFLSVRKYFPVLIGLALYCAMYANLLELQGVRLTKMWGCIYVL